MLNAGKDTITGTPRRSQDWTLDAQGNWSSLTTDSVPEDRNHNAQNQITDIGGSGLQYDNNGNLVISDQRPDSYLYDAWNRLVSTGSGALYAYDALDRRIGHTPGGGIAAGLTAGGTSGRRQPPRPRRRAATTWAAGP